jgi:hypothetical protein
MGHLQRSRFPQGIWSCPQGASSSCFLGSTDFRVQISLHWSRIKDCTKILCSWRKLEGVQKVDKATRVKWLSLSTVIYVI